MNFIKILYILLFAVGTVGFLVSISRAIHSALRMDDVGPLLTANQKVMVRCFEAGKPIFHFVLAFVSACVIFDVKF